MNKKGQIALEFLTTYGWALMVVAIAIGSMSYLYLNNPNSMIPQRCNFQTDFNCQDYAFFEDSGSTEFVFEAENIHGQNINITRITCEYLDETYDARINGVVPPVRVNSSDVFNASCSAMELSPRDIANIRLNVKFIPQGLVFNTTTVGSATVRIQ